MKTLVFVLGIALVNAASMEQRSRPKEMPEWMKRFARGYLAGATALSGKVFARCAAKVMPEDEHVQRIAGELGKSLSACADFVKTADVSPPERVVKYAVGLAGAVSGVHFYAWREKPRNHYTYCISYRPKWRRLQDRKVTALVSLRLTRY